MINVIVNLQEYFCILCIGDNVEEVLGEDVEGVWIIKWEDEDGCFWVFVVAAGDARNSLHTWSNSLEMELRTSSLPPVSHNWSLSSFSDTS